jgi:hypothetical protein
VSYRARFLASENIKICYMGRMNQPNVFQIDTAEINCPIYTKLINSILMEKQSPLRKTLQLFCNKAHYKFKINTEILSEKLKQYISELITNCDVGFSYKNIDNIDYKYAELIQQSILHNNAKMMDKIMLQKYYFQLSFKSSAEFIKMPEDYGDISVIEHSWDNNLAFFFSKNLELLKNPDNIFTAIQILNKEIGIFPSNIKKLKLNKKILDDIFNQFNFKYTTQASKPTKIVKEIFNTFFMKDIITSTYEKEAKNVRFEIDDDYYNFLYDFATENMRYKVEQKTE